MTLRLILAACSLVGFVAPLAAAAPPGTASASKDPAVKAGVKAPDADLLEFLGSFDGDEEGWADYLEQTPVKAQAKAPEQPAAPAKAPEAKPVKSK